MPQNKAGMKAISPIIAIIIILLITIAIAGAGYSYISTYWTSLVGREIQVVSSFCTGDNQAKVMVKNIGTNPLTTGDITVINPLTGEDLTQDITWTSSVSDPDLVLELKLDEGSGTTAKDTSGKGNDGTMNGNLQWVEGRVGRALSFDGVDDYVIISNAPSLNPTTAYTVAVWIRSTGNAEGDGRIISKRSGGAAYEMLLITTSGYIQSYILTSNGGKSTTGTTSVKDGKFHHICITRENSVLKIYVDGVIDITDTVPTGSVANTQNLYIGRYSPSAVRFFNGLIDDVRIYNRALSPDEIAILSGNFQVQPGETATLTHACSGRCRYNLVLGGMAKEAMLEC